MSISCGQPSVVGFDSFLFVTWAASLFCFLSSLLHPFFFPFFFSFCYLIPTLVCLMCVYFLSSPCMATYFNFSLFHVSLHFNFNVCHVIVYFDFVSCYVLLCVFACFNFSLSHVLLFNCYLLMYFVYLNPQKIAKRKVNTNWIIVLLHALV